ALGIALLEYLKGKRAFVFANTHHTPIKIYALSSDYYTPASVLFDKESLKPLYKIVYNSVGESMALIVAQRCGIPQEVIQMAKENLPEGFEGYFSARESLEAYIKEYEQRIRELEEKRKELDTLLEEQERKIKELEEAKRREIKTQLQRIREDFEEFIRQAEAQLKSQKDRKRLRELFEERFQSLEEPQEAVSVGDWVEFMGSRGKVLEVKEGKAHVAFGGVKAWLNLKDLKKTEPPPELQKPVLIDFKKGAPYEINLTGLSVEEALTKLELFLEEAYSVGARVVKVIHGYGTLKKAVLDFLSSSSLVVFHREGYPKEGGAGTTLVYLRKD
ncbi:MAG: endonuclease MutS2, partial [Aquificota bacterium]